MDYSLTVITFYAENRYIRFSKEKVILQKLVIKHFDAGPLGAGFMINLMTLILI